MGGGRTVFITTFCFLVLAILYTTFATKWYKAEALIKIGYYKNHQNEIMLTKTPEVVKELSYIYAKSTLNKDYYIQNISEIKNQPKYFKITSYGKDNALAKEAIEIAIKDLIKSHKNILDQYLNLQKKLFLTLILK
ncbi:hypothetical protein F1B92_03795 [Campylobacter sp. FMV-PI01]|uniref:Uncharacterized protein n=1 Tax=Campylobacter portucalensis TaxID=2608384 RepID=A0A6L5WIM0_9BACT|nr:Wzz/FepE/Etk N-terminal domain-containing protein [Campylobacter portucalensis]MSN96322.1 hypothetical protein [Campylobacter portucalensis]